MKTVHLSSVMIPAMPGIYLTASHNGCITLEGRPSIQWSLTEQNGVGEVIREEFIGVDMARTIHGIATGHANLFDVLIEDLSQILIDLKRTDSVAEMMRMVFAHHIMDA